MFGLSVRVQLFQPLLLPFHGFFQGLYVFQWFCHHVDVFRALCGELECWRSHPVECPNFAAIDPLMVANKVFWDTLRSARNILTIPQDD